MASYFAPHHLLSSSTIFNLQSKLLFGKYTTSLEENEVILPTLRRNLGGRLALWLGLAAYLDLAGSFSQLEEVAHT
jgi:hypothetical protein